MHHMPHGGYNITHPKCMPQERIPAKCMSPLKMITAKQSVLPSHGESRLLANSHSLAIQSISFSILHNKFKRDYDMPLVNSNGAEAHNQMHFIVDLSSTSNKCRDVVPHFKQVSLQRCGCADAIGNAFVFALLQFRVNECCT